jgi:hypothetical protein
MKKIYLHLGLHKTGTTSIQQACVTSPIALAKDGRKYYSGIFKNGNHREISHAILRDEIEWPARKMFNTSKEQTFLAIRRNIEEELKKTNHLVISAESLSYIRHQDEINNLKSLFPNNVEIIPILFLREKNEWLKSYISQFKKRGHEVSESHNSVLNTNPDSWVLRHDELIHILQANFANTIIIDYDENVIKRFSHAIGLSESLPAFRINITKNSQSKNKIFQIGFNKCGTTTIANFLNNNGIKTVHYGNGQLAKIIYLNITAGIPSLQGIEKFTAFTDIENPQENIFGHRFYQTFYEEYPNSYFILNTRDKSDWIKSRLEHRSGLLVEIMKNNFGLTKEQTIKYWELEWDNHHTKVLKYFKNKGNLLVFNLDKASPLELVNFLKPEFDCDEKLWGHYNKTKFT